MVAIGTQTKEKQKGGTMCPLLPVWFQKTPAWCTFQILGGVRVGGQGWGSPGGDNNIQFINIGRVGDKSFIEFQKK